MSELQIGLLALGALVVVCVLAFNKFQELRARRQADRHFASGHEDVLLKGGAKEEAGGKPKDGEAAPPRTWVEPTWNDQLDDDLPVPGDTQAGSAAGVDPLRANTQPGHTSEPVAVHGPAVLDDRIDFIAELQFVEPLLGSHLVMEIEKFAAGRIIGCDGFNAVASDWEALDRDAVYEMARIGIQLSDRGGPLRAEELEQFQQWVDQTAARLGAMVEWTGMQSPLTRAAELDAFCAEVDVQISVNLVSSGPVADTKLRGLSEAHGFKKEVDGVFRRRDEEGLELISLRQSAPVAVTLTYDVPRVPRDAAAFGMLMHCARTIGKGLDAKIVDDNGRPLDEAMQSRIQSSLAGIHARMDAADMPAGGALAQRIFT
jgi:hypothetical protein